MKAVLKVRSSMTKPEKLLFVCTANRQRSPTAESLFEDDERYEARSCGVSALEGTQCDATLLDWADVVFCMEPRHRQILEQRYPEAREKEIVVLNIEDRYLRGEPELVHLLEKRLADWLA